MRLATEKRRARAFCSVAIVLSLWSLVACAPEADDAMPSLYPVDILALDRAVEDGAKLTVDADEVTVQTFQVGSLHLPSGRVVATDPFTQPDREPFALHVEPGFYPVLLSVGSHPSYAVGFPLAAMVRFAETQPVTWYLATIPGQDPTTLEEDEVFGYPVDAGTGAFMSPESARVFGRKSFVLGLPNLLFLGRVNDEMMAHMDEGGWADVMVKKDLNVILFTTGDGFYASYWGMDENGDTACLVTDLAYLVGN
jgi:hypothetical protein